MINELEYRIIEQNVFKFQVRQMVMLSPGCSSPTKSSGGMLRVLGAAQKKEVKATQNLSIIVLFFIICWFPLYTINFVKAFCRDCVVSPTLTNSCIILSHLNSSFNPFLYAYHLKDFRVAFHNLIFGNKDIPLRRRSSFIKSKRSGVSPHRSQPLPTSSLYLYKDDMTRTSDEKKNWRLQNQIWNLTSGCNGQPRTSEKCIPSSYNVLLYGNGMVLPCEDPAVVPNSSGQTSRSRSQSMFAFQTSGVEDLFKSPKIALKIRDFCLRRNNKRGATRSCEDLRMTDSNGDGATTTL